jgi:class 3 adenylate cyclase/tetratricopeptide (TPR) repeat protein
MSRPAESGRFADPYDGGVQAQTPQTEDSVERRIVTVLFADLVGFTSLSEKLDPEDIATIQDAYFEGVRETIARYGGRLEKFIGDAAMAVFGVPRSRDDDAERAVRAGQALINGVQQIGARLGLEDDVLRLRVGINTGEAVIAVAAHADEGRVTGDTVNTAARLQTSAPPNRVLMGETTALAMAAIAELEQVPALELKGKAEPTPAWLLTAFRPEASRELAMGELRAPTLGRERELAALTDAHGRATAGGVERWLIVAPPGVGKSRLLREIADRLDKGAPGSSTVVWLSRARPDSLSPFDPVARLILDALASARLPVSGASDDRQAAAERLLLDKLSAAGAGELRARVVADACLSVLWPSAASQGGSAADGNKPSEDREALFGAWLEGLDALAGPHTQVWLVEDVHWAGGDVLAFLEAAGSRARGATGGPEHGRLVVSTSRPSLLDTNPSWGEEDAPGGRHILRLPTLEQTDARALIAALIGDALPTDLADRIAERSDGNCLFIEELLRTWVSVGTMVRDDGDGDGHWRLTVAAEEVALPASVQSIYAAQLDDLPPDARRLARRASVAGRRFPVGALEPLGTRPQEGLEPLRRRELVSGPLSEPLLGDAFAYRHALLRDAGYASLARAERARLHTRLARWLEEVAGPRSSEVAEQIAGHYAAALESAPALSREIDAGLDRDAVRRLAAEWYERAGQGTLNLSAHDAARQLFRRSIDLTPDEARFEKARRWERLGDATAFAADMDEGAAAYQKAMDLYRKAIDAGSAGFDRGSEALTRASQKMAAGAERLERLSPQGAKGLADGATDLRRGSAEIQEGKRGFQQGLAAAQAGLARSTASLADVWYQQLRFAEARDLVAATMEQLGDIDEASQARLLIARGMSRLGATGPSEDEEADLRRALELSRSSGDKEVELHAYEALTMAREEDGENMANDWATVGEFAARLGRWSSAVTATIMAAARSVDDHASEVFGPIEQARELARAHGLVEDASWTDYLEAEAAFVSGDWDRAVRAGIRAMELAEQNAYRRLNVRTIHVMVPIAVICGDRATLIRAANFYGSLVGRFEFPDSPYSRVIRSAQDLELAAVGLIPLFTLDAESRIVSFQEEPGGGSWSAALDRVFRHWIESGDIDGAGRALAAMSEALPRYKSLSSLGRGTFDLMSGRLAAARADSAAATIAGQAALAHFRRSNAPWWIAKAIRLVERAGSADYQLLTEAFEIERRLGAVQPTA